MDNKSSNIQKITTRYIGSLKTDFASQMADCTEKKYSTNFFFNLPRKTRPKILKICINHSADFPETFRRKEKVLFNFITFSWQNRMQQTASSQHHHSSRKSRFKNLLKKKKEENAHLNVFQKYFFVDFLEKSITIHVKIKRNFQSLENKQKNFLKNIGIDIFFFLFFH
jgi:hypothetical protein